MKILMVIAILSLNVKGDTFDYVGIQCDPALVGETSAFLYVQTTLKTAIPALGFIRLTMPSTNEVSIQAGSLNCTISGDVTQNSLTCTGNTAGTQITIQTRSQINAGATIQVNILGGFRSPTSSAETGSFTLSTFATDEVTILDTRNTAITMIVQPDTFSSASITQIDSFQVGATTTVLVSVRVQNLLLVGASLRMILPKWNPTASTSSQLAMLTDTSTVSCTPRTNVNSTISCRYDTASDTLTVSNAFTNGLAAGTQFQFVLANVRNPLSFAPTTIQIQSLNSAGTGIIERGAATITASVSAVLSSSQAATSANDTTVQTLTNFRLEFTSSLPLNTGAIVTVVFPAQFSFDSKLSTVQGFGLFGSIKNLNFTADDSQKSVKIPSAIDSYKAAGIKAILIFSQVKIPAYVKESDSFSIYLTDASGFQIAQVTTGISFTPTAGQISSVQVQAPLKVVNSKTTFSVQFQPLHSLTSSSLIEMELPTNLDLSCTGITVSGGLSSSMQCSESGVNKFQLTNIFTSSYSYSASRVLQVNFANAVNPGSAQDIKGVSITTFERIVIVGGAQNFKVDTYEDNTQVLYTAQPSQFLSQNVSVNSNQTYTTATFTFNLILDNPIPQNGRLRVVIPGEIAIPGALTCTGIENIAASLSCSKSDQTVTITNGFSNGAVARAQTLKFSLTGLRTPISTKTSSSFQVYSMDSSNFIIDQITSLLTVTMLEGRQVTTFTASSDSNIVAQEAQITISLTPPIPLQDTDQIVFTIPDEIVPPLKSTLQCQGSDSLARTPSCEINGQLLIVTMGLRSSPSKENSSKITIKFKPAKNPQSTKQSSEFQLIIRNVDGYIMAQSKTGTNALIKVGIPSPITKAKLLALDSRQQAFTTITINMTSNNRIPAGGYVEVTFDKVFYQILTDSTVKCTSNLIKNDNVSCEFPEDGRFKVQNLFPLDFPAGLTIDFTINNVFLDFKEKGQTPSWTVTTMTPDGFLIDRVSDILTINFPCNVPCQTCLSNNPNYCLSCNSATSSTILYNNKCLSQCPDSLYFDQDTLQCRSCDPKCKTCSFSNPSECTSCNIFSADFPFLEGNTCTNKCSFGTFANNKTAQCESCSSPCESCGGSATQCLTCIPTINNKFQHNNKCVTQCPSGFISVPDTNNVCQACSSNCFTCVGRIDFCTSCKFPLLLSEYDNTCVNQCPFGKTVYNAATKVCQKCDPTCNSCQNQASFCTSCAENLNLWPSTGTCLGECSQDKKFVGFNGVCTACSDQCLTCVNKPDSCLSCSSGLYLFDYSCVGSCPSGYEADDNNQCVIKGLRCPFGQQVNAAGTACELKVQICEEGKQLNQAKDRCIPLPGTIAPFPLCFACLFMAIIIIISWIKYKETLIVSNIIAVMSLIETIGILVQIGLAYQIGVYSTFGLSLVAVLFLFGCNLFFTIVFLKQVQTDPAFKYWGLTYKITQNSVIVIGSIVNFKFFRVIYARFFGKDNFNAAFDDPEAFFKPFTLVSVFSLLTTMLPLIVANIIGLVFIEFGYQVQMCCIELTIIELVLLALMIYEKIRLKKYAMKQHQYYKVEPKLIQNAQVNVMSSIMDEQSNMYSLKTNAYYNSKTSAKTEENLLSVTQNLAQKEKKMPAQFHEYYERRRMLEKLISKIYSKDAVNSQNGQTTVDFISKLQEEEILRLQERFCRSFRELREVDDDFADQDAAELEVQNFISAPTSPREKEMLYNPFFIGRMAEFKKAMKKRDYFDNCYAESKPAYYFPMRDTKLITVKVQTNIMELLAIDDITRARASKEAKRHDSSEDEEYVEENLNGDYTQGLIDNLIDTYKEHQFTKQRRRLPKSRLQEIPNFEMADIQGEFDLDENNQSIMIKSKDGKLNDREGRKVNKSGYLIDTDGNIITNRGQVIFKIDEVDSDDEIPAPFCFEKKKELEFKIEDLNQYNQRQKRRNVKDEMDDIEREYRLLRQKNASHQSSVDSLMGETPSKYNQKNKRIMPGDDDGFLSKIVQPMQAKSKNELLKLGGGPSSSSETKRNAIRKSSGNVAGASGPRRNAPALMQESTKTVDSSAQKQRPTQIPPIQNINSSANKPSSIGGYDTSIQDEQSARDLFFSTLAQAARPKHSRQTMLGDNNTLSSRHNNRSTTYQYQSQDIAAQMKRERISKIQELKETLGGNQEDRALLKQLSKFESTLLGKSQQSELKKSSLVKKNLKKVYGKVQSKLSQDMETQQNRPPFNISFLENGEEIMAQSTLAKKKMSTQDTKIRDLQNIYIKSVNQDRKIASQMQRQRNWALNKPTGSSFDGDRGFGSGGQNTAKHRVLQHSLQDTGVESSDQDEIRMRQQLNKMQAIIDKGQKVSSKLIPKSNNKLFEGGWI